MSGIIITPPTVVSSLELSQGLMSVLPGNIINFNNASYDGSISQVGLLPSNVLSPPANPDGHIYIMKGTMPVAPNLTSIPFSNVLLDFSVQSGSFIVQTNVNPVVISTTYLTATGTGSATWFLLTAYSNIGTIYQQAIGTVGLTGSGSDLEISDTVVTSGLTYRILNLRLLFQSAWSQ